MMPEEFGTKLQYKMYTQLQTCWSKLGVWDYCRFHYRFDRFLSARMRELVR